MWFRFLAFPLALLAGLAVAALLAVALVLALAYPNLPSLQALTEYQPKIPLRIYSAEGVLMGEFGEERRSVVSIEEVPDALKHAILAAEDERFYEHPGIDYVGVLRAAYANLVAGGRRRGADLLRQVARAAEPRRDRHARRAAQGALHVQPGSESATLPAKAALRFAADVRAGAY